MLKDKMTIDIYALDSYHDLRCDYETSHVEKQVTVSKACKLPIYIYFVKSNDNEYEEIYSRVHFNNVSDTNDNAVFYNDELGLYFEESNLRKVPGVNSINSLKQEEEARRRMCNQEELKIDEFIETVSSLNEDDREYRANLSMLLLTKSKPFTK